MASITIRNLGDGIKRRPRVRAAEHGRSVEEAREIPHNAVRDSRSPLNLADRLRARATGAGGIVGLEIPARDALRDPPTFDG